ncbi:MAG: CDP-diacylglycerol--serine O-phosphatidyltransferase [Labilithrix sp.]|nr:CDP-diacylglycerol--serine O-phosphatidyltransferase [Labilithrix sp.]MCW5817849.1 CDP-diacylglycerol--serine O-phosphatidyltransferase [Labilithrix sp.]
MGAPAIKKKKLDLRKTLFLLPNLITLTSIFCGFDSIRLSASAQSDEDYYLAALLVVYALFFDMLDGRVARLTKTQSAFGLQIDSLADVVSFGVAPSLLVYKWSLERLGTAGIVIAFLFTAAGAVRLARFNVLSMGENGQPTKPGKYIVGLPVPGAAGVLLSLVIANHAIGGDLGSVKYLYAMAGLVVFLSFLMVSTVKFRSFKDLKLNARSIGLVMFAVVSSAAVALKTKPAFVLVWLLGCYVVIALVETMIMVPRGIAERRRARADRTSIPPT